MRLVTLNNLRLAQSFVDYMKGKGITILLESHHEGEIGLILPDETQQQYVIQELQVFLLNPTDQKYLVASWENGNEQSKLTKDRHYYPSFSLTVSPLVLVITTITFLFYLFQQIYGDDIALLYFGFPDTYEEYFQLWRYITPIFLHFSISHIVFNLLWWWYLGGMIERNAGKGKLLEITLLSAILSNYCESIVFGVNFGGLSGVIYGLMAYCWLIGVKKVKKGIYLENAMMILILFWLIAGYAGWLGPVANTAHLVGLLVGLCLAIKDSLIKR